MDCERGGRALPGGVAATNYVTATATATATGAATGTSPPLATITSSTSTSTARVQCPLCNRCFGRQEHLTRHLRIHTRERPFPCPLCPKSFARVDVLNRHKAAHEEQQHCLSPSTLAPTAGSRACIRCASDRLRCSRGQPCRRCSQRGFRCLIPLGRLSQPSHPSPGPQPPSSSSPSQPGLQDQLHSQPREGCTGEDTSNQTGDFGTDQSQSGQIVNDVTISDSVEAAPPLTDWPWIVAPTPTTATASATVATPTTSSRMNVYNLDRIDNSFGLPGLGLSDINWLSPQYQNALDLDALLATLGPGLDPLSSTHPDAITSTQLSGPVSPQPTLVSVNIANHVPDSAFSASNSGNSTLSSENRYYVDGPGARAPFGRARFGNKSADGSLVQSLDMQEDEDDNGKVTAGRPVQPPSCPTSAYHALTEAIIAESRACSVQLDIPNLPSFEQVQLFVHQYFSKFHPAFPFLRSSSFADEVSSSWLLLLAVIVVGSKFSRALQGIVYDDALSKLLSLILTRRQYRMAQENSSDREGFEYCPGTLHSRQLETPELSTLQAGILNIVSMLHSGRQSLVDRALNERHLLVESCRRHGLFVQHAVLDRSVQPNARTSHDGCSHWWLIGERKARLGAMVHILDAICCYEFQAVALMRLEDYQALLPAPEEYWENPNLRQQDHHLMDLNPKLEVALEMLYIEKRLPPGLGDLSTSLLIMTIYQHTQTVVARDRIRLNSWVPSALPQRRLNSPSLYPEWLPSTRSATKWRNSACDSLDILHWPANSKVARRSGFEHHTILQLHLARLIILTPTNYIQTLAMGHMRSEDNHRAQGHGEAYSAARLQVLQWVIQDHCKARLALVHCGALFWHVRRYSCDSYLEPYAIFMATLILWAFCLSMHLPEVARATSLQTTESPEPSFLHLDRPLDDELVQTYVRLGQKMSAYIANVGNIQDQKAPARIVKEGLCLLAKTPQDTPSNLHHLPVSDLVDSPYTWGIEQSYKGFLASLVQD